jgi:hypothetical protein
MNGAAGYETVRLNTRLHPTEPVRFRSGNYGLYAENGGKTKFQDFLRT